MVSEFVSGKIILRFKIISDIYISAGKWSVMWKENESHWYGWKQVLLIHLSFCWLFPFKMLFTCRTCMDFFLGHSWPDRVQFTFWGAFRTRVKSEVFFDKLWMHQVDHYVKDQLENLKLVIMLMESNAPPMWIVSFKNNLSINIMNSRYFTESFYE